jgi:hypothetical protein
MVPEGGSDDLAPKLFPKPNDAIFGSGRNFVYDLWFFQTVSVVRQKNV